MERRTPTPAVHWNWVKSAVTDRSLQANRMPKATNISSTVRLGDTPEQQGVKHPQLRALRPTPSLGLKWFLGNLTASQTGECQRCLVPEQSRNVVGVIYLKQGSRRTRSD